MYRAVLAVTPADRAACYRVRHRVYVDEQGYEPPRPDGLETDALDAVADHIALSDDGRVVGTARLIAHGTVGEISRFCVLRGNRCPAAMTELIERLYIASWMRRLTHWVALMEPALFRLLARHGVEFIPVGPAVSYRGPRRFGVADLRELAVSRPVPASFCGS